MTSASDAGMRDRRLKGIETIIQCQQHVLAKGDDEGFLFEGQHRPSWFPSGRSEGHQLMPQLSMFQANLACPVRGSRTAPSHQAAWRTGTRPSRLRIRS